MSVHRTTVEGRVVRRGRAFLAGILGLAMVGGLSVAYGSLTGDAPAEPQPGAVPTDAVPSMGRPSLTIGLTGRLVYSTSVPGEPGRERLWVLDLATGAFERGPEIPESFEILTAGPDRAWLLIHSQERGRTASYLLRDLSAEAEPVRIARSQTEVLSRDGEELFVGVLDEGRRGACVGRYEVRVVVLETGRETPASEDDVPCGIFSGAALYGSGTPVVSVRRRYPPAGYLLGPNGPEQVFPVAFYVWSSGPYLFASSRNDLVVWPGGGTPHPLLTGSRAVGRPMASTSDGRYLALAGAVDDLPGIWIVDVASGTVLMGADALPPRPRVFDATFADDGTVYLVGWDGITAAQPLGVRVVPIPLGAPEPRGQVVWLP